MRDLNKLAVLVWIMAGVYFLYVGVTTEVWEGDSLAYHLPIARNILQGKWWDFDNLLEYYPASQEILLAVWTKIGMPVNAYGVVGWGILWWICKRWKGVVFATAVTMLPSVIRLPNTQTVDIWLAVWWLFSVVELEQFSKGSKWRWLRLGLFLGMLVGTKYSGVGFGLVLLGFYSRKIWGAASIKGGIVLAICIVAVGGGWYIRNWVEHRNAFYPAGEVGFELLNWSAGKTVVYHPGQFLTAMGSEFLIWSVAFAAAPFLNNKLGWLAWANFGVYLLAPSWPENVVSDLRYAYPAVIAAVASIFSWAKKRGELEKISMMAILNAIAVLPQLNYYPKLIWGYLMVVGVWVWRKKSRQ